MSFLQSITRIKNNTAHQPDFERFVRAITTNEPGPVPVGEIFADHETVGNFLGKRVFDYSNMAADPHHKITFRDFWDGLRYVDQTIRFCLATGLRTAGSGMPCCTKWVMPVCRKRWGCILSRDKKEQKRKEKKSEQKWVQFSNKHNKRNKLEESHYDQN